MVVRSFSPPTHQYSSNSSPRPQLPKGRGQHQARRNGDDRGTVGEARFPQTRVAALGGLPPEDSEVGQSEALNPAAPRTFGAGLHELCRQILSGRGERNGKKSVNSEGFRLHPVVSVMSGRYLLAACTPVRRSQLVPWS